MSSNDSQLRAEQSGASDDSIQQVHARLQKQKPEKADGPASSLVSWSLVRIQTAKVAAAWASTAPASRPVMIA